MGFPKEDFIKKNNTVPSTFLLVSHKACALASSNGYTMSTRGKRGSPLTWHNSSHLRPVPPLLLSALLLTNWKQEKQIGFEIVKGRWQEENSNAAKGLASVFKQKTDKLWVFLNKKANTTSTRPVSEQK